VIRLAFVLQQLSLVAVITARSLFSFWSGSVVARTRVPTVNGRAWIGHQHARIDGGRCCQPASIDEGGQRVAALNDLALAHLSTGLGSAPVRWRPSQRLRLVALIQERGGFGAARRSSSRALEPVNRRGKDQTGSRCHEDRQSSTHEKQTASGQDDSDGAITALCRLVVRGGTFLALDTVSGSAYIWSLESR
jgi:hypothetical protein